MPSFDTLKTADYSPLLVHFTKDQQMHMSGLITEEDPLFTFREVPAIE